MLCLLIREFPLHLAIRLLDTYLSEGDEMANLHVYTVTNLILKCGLEVRDALKIDKKQSNERRSHIPSEFANQRLD